MFAGRAGLSDVMIGRADALDGLIELVECAQSCPVDSPAIGLISGEAGVGKTRLVRECLTRTGLRVGLAASAEASEAGTPYGFIRRLLGIVPTDLDQAVAATIDRLGDGLVGLIVDDLHWIDAESVTVIDRISELPRGDLVILITYRPEDLHRRLPGGEFLLRLERRRSVDRFNLSRFTRVETAGFLDRLFDRTPTTTEIEAVQERTGGNPFVIEELARCVASGTPEELVRTGLPWSLEEIVSGRLDGLSQVERAVVETAAVCGSSSSFDLLAAVAGLSEDELLGALRSLVRRDLLVETSDDRFAFRHALVRDAVAGQLLGRERRRLHARALEALGESGDLEARARHAEGAGRFDEFVALARVAASQALARGSSFAALRLADAALGEAPDDPTLLGIAAEASWLVGADAETEAIAARWLASARAADDLAGEAEATRWLARAAFERGDESSRAVLTERLATIADMLGPGLPRARAMVATAQNHMLFGRGDETRYWADRALAEAATIGPAAEPVRIQALVERASACDLAAHPGDLDSAVIPGEALRSALAEAEAAELWSLAARAVNNLSKTYPPHSDEAIDLLRRYENAAARAGYDAVTSSVVAARRAAIQFGLGDQMAVRRALASARQWVSARHSGWELILLEVLLALEDGDRQQAIDGFERLQGVVFGQEHTAALDLIVRCAVGGARRSLADDVQSVRRASKDVSVGDMVMVALAVLDLGHPPSEVRLALTQAATESAVDAAVAIAYVEAIVAAVTDPAMGARLLAPLLERPDPWLQLALVGELRLRRAEALVASGDSRAALAEVDRAITGEFARWPGVRRDRAEALRRRLVGTTVPVAVRAETSGDLTQREREVAMLLAEGLSNGQLGRRLSISPKTAAVHVSNILAKLQMANRAEVAAWAVRTGIARRAA